MQDHHGKITFFGNPLTLYGNEVKVGEQAPDFTALSNDLSPTTLSQFKGKKVIISTVPSLDTGVCSTQTRKFNEEAAGLGEDAVVLTLSCDLPFAQKRWCGAEGVDRVITLSDHRDLDFAMKYGLLIKELRLLARSVMVVDKEGVVRYKELVNEVTHEPDYSAAIEALKAL
ncbi:MAG: thiol peroxidase [Planctomycetota bacterium]